jgi:hypothetical protein
MMKAREEINRWGKDARRNCMSGEKGRIESIYSQTDPIL